MPHFISQDKIAKIKLLRSRGWSLPEIYREVGVGYGSVSRYIKGVIILPEYRQLWLNKRNGSRIRKEKSEKEAANMAEQQLSKVTQKEKLLFIAALYWGEGGKTDFNFTNSDPEMIRIFTSGLRDILGIQQNNIRVSIRLYEDLDIQNALNYWSKITKIPKEDFVSVNILKGKKTGKLKYGLCRIRVKKGGAMLKYLLALNKRISYLFHLSS